MAYFKKTVRYALQEGETVIEVDSLEFDNEKELNRFLEELYIRRMNMSFQDVGEEFNRLSDGFRKARPTGWVQPEFGEMKMTKAVEKASEKNRYSLRVDIE